MAIESIAKTLGTGSGIDISALVNGLVEAQFAAKTAQYEKKGETLEAQVSAAAQLKSSVTGFDAALKSLIKTGLLATKPTSSRIELLKATALTGASVAGTNATVEVRQLASGQVAHSGLIADKSAAVGRGTLTLRFGTASVEDGAMTGFTASAAAAIDIAIDATNSSLDGIAAAINAKKAGVTASVLTDSDGSRLVLKSATGAAQAFTLSATETTGHEGLSALAVGVGATGTTIGSAAQDAIVALDGIAVKRSSNSIADLITGVKLDLVAASVGTKIAIGTEAPTEALGNAVNDFVDTFNELYGQVKAATDPVSGPLRSDTAAKALLRSLQSMTTKQLVTGGAAGAPVTLASIGVATNLDGTLKADTLSLASALVASPGAIEAMFKSGTGLSAALGTIALAASDRTYGLGASEARYTAAKESLSDDQEKAASQAEALRARMTRQFASMDAIVASYKSTQTFLTQQVDAWNKDS